MLSKSLSDSPKGMMGYIVAPNVFPSSSKLIAWLTSVAHQVTQSLFRMENDGIPTYGFYFAKDTRGDEYAQRTRKAWLKNHVAVSEAVGLCTWHHGTIIEHSAKRKVYAILLAFLRARQTVSKRNPPAETRRKLDAPPLQRQSQLLPYTNNINV